MRGSVLFPFTSAIREPGNLTGLVSGRIYFAKGFVVHIKLCTFF